ncbi:MAG: hypothetical protein OXG35_11940 [Acidobacteria bacterium]|nr:hypothetical protein [Acidobacteriota bacterium]
MATPNPELDPRIQELDRALSDDELVDLLLALVRRPDRDTRNMLVHLAGGWPAEGSELLDAAAAVAARHEAWAGDSARLQRWLTVLALSREFAAQLGGEPREILDGLERSALDQARLQGEAIASIWREPMLKPGNAAVALGARATNREKVRRLRERSALLGLPSGNGFLYPAFQFDPLRRGLFAEVIEVNELLAAADDPWGVASWWLGGNARLAERPVDCVGTERAVDLIEAAGAVVEPVG